MEKEASLDDFDPFYIEDVLVAYVTYPQLGVTKICGTNQVNHRNFDLALKQLDDFAGRRVKFTAAEDVWMWGLSC
jgi:hypothetical protein